MCALFAQSANVPRCGFQMILWLICCCFCVAVTRHDLQRRVVDKEAEKQKILEDTKGVTEKNAKIAEDMEKMNQELKNVEK